MVVSPYTGNVTANLTDKPPEKPRNHSSNDKPGSFQDIIMVSKWAWPTTSQRAIVQLTHTMQQLLVLSLTVGRNVTLTFCVVHAAIPD